MYDVFISYASSDIEKAKNLAGIIEQQGWSVWWDREIPPGRSYDEVIEEALDQSKSVVVLWSKASVSSRWVRAEASEGLGRKILVPALIEEVKVPLEFRRLQAARLAGWNGERSHLEIDKLIGAVNIILGHPEAEEMNKKKTTEAMGKTVGEKPEQDKVPEVKSPEFRSTPKENLSKSSVKAMLKQYNFFCREYDWCKEYCNPDGSGFDNKFEKKNNGQVVYDNASGLMWQQSGSDESVTYKNANVYITKLNSDQFAGYTDWRLPTLEEAMSLMESSMKNVDLYIDPMFDKNQMWIWMSDLYSASCAWVVGFDLGSCNVTSFLPRYYVRAVR